MGRARRQRVIEGGASTKSDSSSLVVTTRQDPIDERLSVGIERALARAPLRGRLDTSSSMTRPKSARDVSRVRERWIGWFG